MIQALVPMYNEEAVCCSVAQRIESALRATGEEYEIVFLAGGNDKTYVNLLAMFLEGEAFVPSRYRIIFTGEEGLGEKMRRGFSMISDRADYVLTIDGDGQCVPEQFNRLWEARGHNVTAAYQDESSDSRGRVRRFKSFLATRALKFRYGIQIRSLTLNYRLYQADVLRKVAPLLKSKDFAIQPEIIVELCKCGYRYFGSVPVSWPPRVAGESHARISALEYLRLLL